MSTSQEINRSTKGYIIIFYSKIDHHSQLSGVFEDLRERLPILEWNLDASDSDHVIRIVSTQNIAYEVVNRFSAIGIEINLKAVFPIRN